MALILLGRRARQPQQTPRIDWSNPITRGLVAVFDMTGPAPVDLITRYGTSAGLYSRATTTAGIGQRKNAATPDGLKSFLGANPNSAVVIGSPPNSATIKPFFSQRPNAGGAQYSFGANWNTGFTAAAGSLTLATNGNVNLTNTAAITGALAVYGYSLTSSTTGQLYVNGAPVATTVSGSGYPSIASPEFNILSHSGAGAFNDTATPLIALWNRALTDAEHRSLATNPWQLFAPQARQIYIDSGGATAPSGAFASTLDSSTLVAAGQTTDVGAFATTLASVTLSASGSVGVIPSGSFASSMGDVSLAASGSIADIGSFATTLAGCTLVAGGTVATNPVGSYSSTLGGVSLSASGYVGDPPAYTSNSKKRRILRRHFPT